MRRRAWLAAAALLLVAAALLMSLGDAPEAEAKLVDFPRGLRPAEVERMEKRRTLAPVVTTATTSAPSQDAMPRDPVLAALPSTGGTAIVVEANAIRHSPLGELMVECFLRMESRSYSEWRDELGFDPLEDVDRIAWGGEGVVLISGHFGGARWESLPDVRFEEYGDGGRFLLDSSGEGQEMPTAAVWRDELFLWGQSRQAVRETIDRLEGRLPSEPALDESQTYGEAYGVLASADLLAMLGDSDPLMQRLARVAQNIELHLDTGSDVAISARVNGEQADELRDLGKSLGSAIALGRIKAKAEGDEVLFALLEHARVSPRDGAFVLDLALPLDLIREQLGDCVRP